MAEFASAKKKAAAKAAPAARAAASAADQRAQRLMESGPNAVRSAERERILAASPRAQELGLRGQSLNASRANRTGLPSQLKADIETRSGQALDDVRVHYNSPRPARLAALAYTRGSEIHLGPGQEEHLPHEAWHVVQQKQGRVRPTRRVGGVGINDDPRLEGEAQSFRSVPAAEAREHEGGGDVVQRFDVGAYIEKYGIPALITLVGIGLATYYLKSWFAEAPEKARDKRMLQEERATSEDPVLKKILAEVLETYGDPTVAVKYGHSGEQSHMQRRGGRGSHEAVIDQKQVPEPVHRESFVVHELTHVAADRKYQINEGKGITAQNISSTDPEGDNSFRVQIIIEIDKQLESDKDLLGKLYPHVRERFDRSAVTGQEFDTVVSELFYYLSKVGTSQQKASRTFRLMRAAADAAYEARNSDMPLKNHWVSPD